MQQLLWVSRGYRACFKSLKKGWMELCQNEKSWKLRANPYDNYEKDLSKLLFDDYKTKIIFCFRGNLIYLIWD